MLLLSRSDVLTTEKEKAIYRHFDKIEPGEFRKLIRLADIRTIERDETLLTLGEVPDCLYFLLNGSVEITKRNTSLKLTKPGFLGEVSIILDEAASATCIAEKGSQIIIWQRDRLLPAIQRKHYLKMALEALIATDMARKVAEDTKYSKSTRDQLDFPEEDEKSVLKIT